MSRGLSADRPFLPVPVAELDLSDPAATAEANELGQIWLLVRCHGVPVGSIVRLHGGPAGDEDLVQLAHRTFGGIDARRVGTVEMSPPAPTSASDPKAGAHAGLVSVIVCTLGRNVWLSNAVDSVLDQQDVDLELAVVDNDPESGRVGELLAGISDPRLRVVPEPRRGLSYARNAGLAACRGAVVAFTDDDAHADPRWLDNLVAPLRQHDRVVCTTGLVLPSEIATRAQGWFEEFGAFDKGFDRVVWSMGRPDPKLALLGPAGVGGVLFPYAAGVYGSGNNMAFDVDWLRSRGGFDVALGAGTPTGGGEDLDAFLRVMTDGRALVYEPRALVRHHARSEVEELYTQMFSYGSGMSAVIVKHLASGPRHVVAIALRVPAGLRLLLDPDSTKNADRSPSYPGSLARTELRGYLAGPFLYVRSRARAWFRRR